MVCVFVTVGSILPTMTGEEKDSPEIVGTVSPNWNGVVPSVVIVAKLPSNCESGMLPT